MSKRLNPHIVAPQAMKPMVDLETYLAGCGLEHSLIELVKMRASQINGCAFCLHMHSKDARAAGETEERLYLLNAWRESSLYTPRERAALAWTEALTLLAQTGAPDADYEGLAPHFDETETVNLTLLITTINAWNRIAVGFRSQHPRAWSAKAAA
ncbi:MULTISPECIES: carboxymuconolactone decarboxylase family protein [unclassified Phenylobacterium]|uniref:carboxymuconolactone decarboxylase family protein n=1 Tax=unclassified Phenylobacterium TaxID=2640670 RepID=UPI00083B581B|nr:MULTISPECIES: carboxymuconolactone decarboxylase family protein [unclassified Phenylobacterium]